MERIFIILLLFAIAHFLADCVFITKAMIESKKFAVKLFPLFQHAILHGFLITMVLIAFDVDVKTRTITFCFITFTHFMIDLFFGYYNRAENYDIVPEDKILFRARTEMKQTLHYICAILIASYVYNQI